MCRYGKPGCDAETCDYFLSYRRIGTDVEYEMSADTDGWVAVGFSSDKKMVSSCTNSLIRNSYVTHLILLSFVLSDQVTANVWFTIYNQIHMDELKMMHHFKSFFISETK